MNDAHTPANEPDDFLDRVAIAAMQSLILKVPLHDRRGERGVHTPEITDIHQVRLDIAESAYDYANAMRTARCSTRVADSPTPPEVHINGGQDIDAEAGAIIGKVVRQVIDGIK